MTSFQDIFKKGFIENFDGELNIWTVGSTLLFAFLAGLFIYLVYRLTFNGVVFVKSFGTSLVMVAMVTAMIILPIGTNFVISLGMVGALSIVRFRTAVKDPLDTIFMFWAIGAGIVLGAGLIAAAFISSFAIGLFLFIWNLFKSKNNMPYILVLRFDDSCKKEVQNVLRKLPQGKLKSKIVSQGTMELTIEMNIKESEMGVVDAFGNIPGVHDASLISYKGDIVS